MLRVHFLNVGHGDCTIVQHHSGRLSMVDINTSQDYDAESFKELLAEHTRKHPLAAFGSGGGLGGEYNALFGPPPNGGLGTAFNSLLGPPTGYFEAMVEAKCELQDPIDFMKQTYPNRRAVAVYPHPPRP